MKNTTITVDRIQGALWAAAEPQLAAYDAEISEGGWPSCWAFAVKEGADQINSAADAIADAIASGDLDKIESVMWEVQTSALVTALGYDTPRGILRDKGLYPCL